MGMEYLKTNNRSLAGSFLSASARLCSRDPLVFNELVHLPTMHTFDFRPNSCTFFIFNFSVDDTPYHTCKGVLSYREGRNEEAEDHLRTALELYGHPAHMLDEGLPYFPRCVYPPL